MYTDEESFVTTSDCPQSVTGAHLGVVGGGRSIKSPQSFTGAHLGVAGGGRRDKYPQARLPPYLPKMPQIDLQIVEDLDPKGLKDALEWLTTEKRYENLLRSQPRKTRQFTPTKPDMEDHIELLNEADLLEERNQDEIVTWAKLFLIDEPHKGRSRVIIEPRTLNKAWKLHLPHTNLPQLDDVERTLTIGRQQGFVISADLKCFYYQIPLLPQVRRYFGVRIGSKTFQLKKLPMGASISVYVAQKIAEAMIRSERNSIVYIDNFLCIGDAITHTAAKARATLGMTERTEDTLEYLGLEVSLAKGTLRLNQKFGSTHSERLRLLNNKQIALLDIWRLLGAALRFTHVMRIPLALHVNILRLARRTMERVVNGEPWSTETTLIEEEATDLRELLLEAVQRPTRSFEATGSTTATPWVIFADATPTSMGSAIVKTSDWSLAKEGQGSISFYKAAIEERDINAAEARAAWWAIETALDEDNHQETIVLLTDNTTVYYALTKGHGRNEVNECIAGICRRIGDREIHVGWIPSNENWADGPSRGRIPTHLANVTAEIKRTRWRVPQHTQPHERTGDESGAPRQHNTNDL